MKHLVRPKTVSAEQIRPPAALQRFRAAAESGAAELRQDMIDVSCPACSNAGAEAFTRGGFTYRRCLACESLFVSPRPTAQSIERFYRETPAGKLRVEYLQAATDERLEHVVRSRIDWIANLTGEGTEALPPHLVDMGTVYPSFLREARNERVVNACTAVDTPRGLAAAVREAGAEVATDSTSVRAGIVTAFEQLEHQVDVRSYLSKARSFLEVGGWFFATTRSGGGFDTLVLWDQAPYLFVPEHLNLLSVEGLQTLFEAHGFELVELSTPGQLDVELVERSADETEIALPRFVRYLLRHRNERCRADLQEFLQKHRLSSHVRIAARAI